MKKKRTVREIALNILEDVEKKGSYSNLLLNNAIKVNDLSKRDVALLTEITYGTIQRQLTIDFYLQPFIKGKLQSWVRQLLRLTVYQIVYLEKVPDRAAIYEAVEISKKRGHQAVSRLVNGVLRSFQRNELRSFAEITDPIESLAIETSHPIWLVTNWVNDYGFEKTRAMCESNLSAPVQTARVNINKISREQCINRLEEEGFAVEASQLVKEGIRSLKGNLVYSKCYEDGLITIQDESSMLVANILNPQKADRILDACAAPGGKTTHIAEKMAQTGEVIALDIHEHKVNLLNKQLKRLELTNVEAKVMDSLKAADNFKENYFDRILLDAPCSGFGVVRRKPDAKYSKKENVVKELHQLQVDLLEEVARLLKDEGVLVYSSCTVNKVENEKTIEKFLQKNKNFELDGQIENYLPESARNLVSNGMLQIFPQDFNSDGFFIARLRKKV